MSPSGKLPFIRCGAFVVADLDPIINFVVNKVIVSGIDGYIFWTSFSTLNFDKNKNQGISLTDHLDAGQRADMRAYMSLANNILGNAEVKIF